MVDKLWFAKSLACWESGGVNKGCPGLVCLLAPLLAHQISSVLRPADPEARPTYQTFGLHLCNSGSEKRFLPGGHQVSEWRFSSFACWQSVFLSDCSAVEAF